MYDAISFQSRGKQTILINTFCVYYKIDLVNSKVLGVEVRRKLAL